MSTIIAATSNADGATTTTAAYQFNGAFDVKAKCTNGAPAPSQPCRAWLQLSPDGVNWQTVDIKLFGLIPSYTYVCNFELSQYEEKAQQYGYASWSQFRLLFVGNVGAAVTVAADNTAFVIRATVPLIATTATTGGAAGSWTPPEGTEVIITRCVINVVTGSTGVASVNAGVAANATTGSSNLIAATSVHTSGVIIDSNSTSAAAEICAAGSSVTFTASATLAGMVATAYIDYLIP